MLTKQLQRDKLPTPVEEVDIEQNPELCKKHNITAVPTLVLVDSDGNELCRIVGQQPSKMIRDKFNAFLVQW